MIVTVTPNPALDQFYWVDRVNDPQTALLTRAEQTLSSPGGKGINVSLQIKALGMDSTTMGFIAGYMGHAIEHSLHAAKITTNFVWTDGESRTNVIIIVKRQEASPLEVNADGPVVSEMALRRFSKRYQTALKRNATLMFGGSLPPGVPDDFYLTMIKKAQDKGLKTLLYASGEAFNLGCQCGPWIAKPDLRERSEVLGKPVSTQDQVYAVGRKLLETGSQIAIMAHGLSQPVASQMVLTQQGVWNYDAVDVRPVNRVGAGDAFLSGMLFKLERGEPVPSAARYGMATSLACTEAHTTTINNRAAIERALQRVKESSL